MAMVVQSQPMLARRLLRLAVIGALTRAKTANSYDWLIDTPGDWDTAAADLVEGHAEFKVRCGDDSKSSIDRGATMGIPKFDTSIDIEIHGRIQEQDEATAQDNIEALAYTVENLLLTDKPLGDVVQAYRSVRTRSEITAEGRQHLAGFVMMLTLEVYEEFDASVLPPPATSWPPTPNPIVPLKRLGLYLDLANVFDSLGTYAPGSVPFQPWATPAPRESGPDGRIEGALYFDSINYFGPGALDDQGDYTGFMLDVSELE